MAYLKDFEVKEENATVASHTVVLPAHVTNDLLIILGSKDGSGTMTIGDGTWTQAGTTQSANGLNVSAVFYKVATSSAETAPTLSTNTNDGWVSLSLCIGDADTTTPLDATTIESSNAASSQFAQAGITSSTNNALILYLMGVDGSSSSMLSDPGTHSIISFDNAGTTYGACAAGAWYFQAVAGASPTCGWTGSLSSGTNRFTLAIKNKASGIIPPYIDDVISPGTNVTNGNHYSTLNGISFPGALSLATIAGKTTAYDAATATGDLGINPYSSALSSTPAATASTNTAGFQINFTASKDFSTVPVMGTLIAANPRDGAYDLGSIVEGGYLITFADVSNNYRAYQVAARDSTTNGIGRNVWVIDPNQATTAFGVSGTLAANAVTYMVLTANCPKQAITFYHCEIHTVGTHVLSGGTSTNPVDIKGVEAIGRHARLPVIQKVGSSLLSYAPLQVGGGDAVNFQLTTCVLQFPRVYNTTEGEINYHRAATNRGISYAGKSGDVIKHINGLVTSPDKYYWEINTAATSAATWDFSGLTVVNAVVTLRNVTTFTKMVFRSCDPIAIGSAIVTSCEFATHTGNNAITLASAAESAAVDNCIFTGNTRAVKITTAGTYEFNGHIFSGNTYDIENSSAGSVIVNNINGSNATTFVNTGGGSTTINNVVNITVKCVDESLANLQSIVVYIENASTKAQILSASTNGSGIVTTTFNYVSDTAINIRIRKASTGGTKYVPIKTTGTITNTGFNLTATLYVDSIAAA